MVKHPWRQSTAVSKQTMVERICRTGKEFAADAISKWGGAGQRLDNRV